MMKNEDKFFFSERNILETFGGKNVELIKS